MTLALDKLPTPETDANLLRYTGGELVTFPRGLRATVDADFARSLEQRLAYALPYMRDKPDCYRHITGGGDCTCGLDAFLALLREPGK